MYIIINIIIMQYNIIHTYMLYILNKANKNNDFLYFCNNYKYLIIISYRIIIIPLISPPNTILVTF